MEAEDEDDYNDQEIDTPFGHRFHDESSLFNMEDMMYPLGRWTVTPPGILTSGTRLSQPDQLYKFT